ncbi:MAG: twin-arginine translocase TatA/TatE family subunit [Gemmataceae bacterium]
MLGLGSMELVVLLIAALFLFGNKLPTLARWLGRTVVEFRREASQLSNELNGTARPQG